ncbi:hypothetical protein [Microbulbifer aggregans]|uniref:hypothetical protein n=1 Tax=Microbulbifer aggregans TaxID=1769779 RepID=UPI001CFD33B6|nr:hypothetical protein [Microbulbifer aggregans]
MKSNKFDRNENPDWEPDALVRVCFSSKDISVKNGYRPHYKVKDDYLTTTLHWFIDEGFAEPKRPTLAFVKFITPEAYPNCLEVGANIEILEGPRVVGHAEVQEIYNEQLRKNS